MTAKSGMAARLSGLRFGDRHSRRVDRLRFILPATALSLLGLVMVWPWLTGGYDGLIVPMFTRTIGADIDPMRMLKPRYVGLTKDSEAYEVTASSAFLDPTNPDDVYLDRLTAILDQTPSGKVHLTAAEGIYFRGRDALNLSGGLELVTSQGYRFRTASAMIDLGLGRVVGEESIAGQGPAGTLAADRFTIEDGGDVLRFEGRVQMVVHPDRPS